MQIRHVQSNSLAKTTMSEHVCAFLNVVNMHQSIYLFYYSCNSVIHRMPSFPEFGKSELSLLPFVDELISPLFLFCSLENSDGHPSKS